MKHDSRFFVTRDDARRRAHQAFWNGMYGGSLIGAALVFLAAFVGMFFQTAPW